MLRLIARAGTDGVWALVPIDLADANVNAFAPGADGELLAVLPGYVTVRFVGAE